MRKWQVAAELAPHAYEWLGEAEGFSFEAACRMLAERSSQFGTCYDPDRATFMGKRLVSLGQVFHADERQQIDALFA